MALHLMDIIKREHSLNLKKIYLDGNIRAHGLTAIVKLRVVATFYADRLLDNRTVF